MQLALDGRTPVDVSLAIIREFEPPEGYYLAFSGGKDSVVLYDLAVKAGVKFDVHYSMTTIDPPELTRFIRHEYPDVAWEKPPYNFFEGVRRNGFPTRTARWCCKVFKEQGGVGRKVLLGLRAEESSARARRPVVGPCRKGRKWFVSPIRDWLEADVWEYIHAEGLPYCSLYDEGWKRLGCVVCPFERNVARSMARWPTIWRLMREAMFDRYAINEVCQKRWATPQAMWEWWIDRDASYKETEVPQLHFTDLDWRAELDGHKATSAVAP